MRRIDGRASGKRYAEIVRSDQKPVESFDVENVLDIAERRFGFDHGERERQLVGLREIGVALHAEKPHGTHRAPTAPADRRELHGVDEGAGVRRRVDHRRDEARRAHVERPRAERIAVERQPHHRGLARKRRRRDALCDRLEGREAVLGVKRHRIEARPRHCLDDHRRGREHPAGEMPAAGPERSGRQRAGADVEARSRHHFSPASCSAATARRSFM